MYSTIYVVSLFCVVIMKFTRRVDHIPLLPSSRPHHARTKGSASIILSENVEADFSSLELLLLNRGIYLV